MCVMSSNTRRVNLLHSNKCSRDKEFLTAAFPSVTPILNCSELLAYSSKYLLVK